MDSTADAVIQQLAQAQCLDDVACHSQRFARALGYPYFMFALSMPGVLKQRREMVLTNYPDEWLARYSERAYFQVDPVYRRSLDALEPVWWDAIDRSQDEVRSYFADAAQHGLAEGVTVPLYGPNSERHALSLGGTESPTREAVREAQCSQIWRFAVKAVPTIRRFVVDRSPRAKYEALTERQRQVLTLMSEGMLIKQIADRLNIDMRTVNYLLGRCVQKLGVSNREQAIVRGMATGQIRPLAYYPSSFEFLSGDFSRAPKARN